MSKYTKNLYDIINDIVIKYSKDKTLEEMTFTERITFSLPYIFSFDYNLFDNSHKEELETKLIRHYYTREIGFETTNLWLFKLEERLLSILPKYNDLYKSNAINYDILNNYSITETSGRDIKRDYTGSSNTTTNTKQVGYITPENIINTENMDNYANTMNTNNTNSNASGVNNETSLDNYTSTRSGVVGISPTSLIREYRDSIINIDEMFIEEFENLFMEIF